MEKNNKFESVYAVVGTYVPKVGANYHYGILRYHDHLFDVDCACTYPIVEVEQLGKDFYKAVDASEKTFYIKVVN